MPDITMCKSKKCPSKDSCYRHTAIPCEYRQAYFVDMEPPKDWEYCSNYWPVREGTNEP